MTVSIHAPRAGRDIVDYKTVSGSAFQSTRPARDATARALSHALASSYEPDLANSPPFSGQGGKLDRKPPAKSLAHNLFTDARTSVENAESSTSAQQPSHNEWTGQINGRLRPMVFYTTLKVRAQIVEPQAVCCRVEQLQQPQLQPRPLRVVNEALEDRVLDTLPAGDACLGDVSQPPSASGVLRRHVITHHNEHEVPSFPDKGWIVVQVATQVAREQESLQVHKHPYGGALSEERL